MSHNSDESDSSDLSDAINDDEFDDEINDVKGQKDVDNEDDDKVIEETKNSNFADAMKKILSATVDDKENPVLAKRKLNYVEEPKTREERIHEAKLIRTEKKRVEEIGHVLPSEDDREAEHALRKIATKGATALFNAISRSKRALPQLEMENEMKKKKEKKTTPADALQATLEKTTKKMSTNGQNEKKWSVLNEDMLEKNEDMKNWDTEKGDEDDWDEEVDL